MKTLRGLIVVMEVIGLLSLFAAASICLLVFQLGWWTALIGMLFIFSGLCLVGAEAIRDAIKSD